MKIYKLNLIGTEYTVVPQIRNYTNGRKALSFIDSETGEPIATASVNLPNEPLKDDEIFIKNWSENEGMLDFLIENEMVLYWGKDVQTGYVSANKCRLLLSEE